MKRTPLLLITTLAILLLVILASGLSALRLKPAQPMILNNGEAVNPVQDSLTEVSRGFNEISPWQQILLVGSFLLAVLLAIIFMPAEARKKFLMLMLKLGILAFIILYFLDDFKLESEGMMPEETIPMLNTAPDEGEIVGIPPEIIQPEEVSPIWSYVITLFVVVVLGIIIWLIWRKFANSPPEEDISLKKISRIAKASRDDLEKGAEWENIIIRSYVEMGEVINERRGIKRQSELTPQEFSAKLILAGIPAEPVQRLTQLFERARYSTHSADEGEVEEAVKCLDEIASVFGEKLES